MVVAPTRGLVGATNDENPIRWKLTDWMILAAHPSACEFWGVEEGEFTPSSSAAQFTFNVPAGPAMLTSYESLLLLGHVYEGINPNDDAEIGVYVFRRNGNIYNATSYTYPCDCPDDADGNCVGANKYLAGDLQNRQDDGPVTSGRYDAPTGSYESELDASRDAWERNRDVESLDRQDRQLIELRRIREAIQNPTTALEGGIPLTAWGVGTGKFQDSQITLPRATSFGFDDLICSETYQETGTTRWWRHYCLPIPLEIWGLVAAMFAWTLVTKFGSLAGKLPIWGGSP